MPSGISQIQQVLDEEMTPKAGNKLVSIKEIVSIIVGYAFKSTGYSAKSSDIKLICGDNLEPGFFRWSTTKYWPREKASPYTKFLLRKDDVILAMDRPWIKSGLKRALVTDSILPALLLQRTACLRAPSKEIAEYVYFILGSSAFSEHVLSKQTGASVPHISEKQIASFQLYIPTEKRIHSVVQCMSFVYDKVKVAEENYRRFLSLCAELKQQVLNMAFNGEL